MNHRIFFSFLFLSSFYLSYDAERPVQDSTVHYFSTLEFVETPLSCLKGSIPLSKEVASTRNHYRFTYDDKNRLSTIAFFNGNIPRHPNHTSNLFMLAHRLKFTYLDTTEIISFYDTKGVQISVMGDCYQFIYQLNELGFRESLYFKDKTGKHIENSWGIYYYQWKYQFNGSVIENRFNKSGEEVSIRPGFEFYRLRLHFNPVGHIALMQNIDEKGNLIENASGAAQDQIKTNAAGNFLQWQVLDKNGQLERGNGPDVATGKQTFNEFGYETGLENRDENNQFIFNNYGICQSETEFDDWGNIKERRFYNEFGAPTLHKKAGYFKLKIHWDNTGNFRDKLEYFDIQGNPVVHAQRGYHQVKYQYDHKKNLVKISYHDTKGGLINRRDNGTAYITYEYDKMGKALNTLRYSSDHEVIQD